MCLAECGLLLFVRLLTESCQGLVNATVSTGIVLLGHLVLQLSSQE